MMGLKREHLANFMGSKFNIQPNTMGHKISYGQYNQGKNQMGDFNAVEKNENMAENHPLGLNEMKNHRIYKNVLEKK